MNHHVEQQEPEHKNFSNPENETRNFTNGTIQLVTVAGSIIGLATLKPGWKWSKDVKPIVRTKSCQAPHFFYLISGRMRIRMDDGKEFEIGGGDVVYIPAGHDAWVVGNEPAVTVDWFGARLSPTQS